MSIESARKWYPRAPTSVDTRQSFTDTFETHLTWNRIKRMHADSICRDDVNAIQHPPRAYEMLGLLRWRPNGFPFAGITEWMHLQHHVPEDGAVIIFMLPISELHGMVLIGEISRIGQTTTRHAAVQLVGALNKLLNNEIIDGYISSLDFQMNTIEQIFLHSKERIKMLKTRYLKRPKSCMKL